MSMLNPLNGSPLGLLMNLFGGDDEPDEKDKKTGKDSDKDAEKDGGTSWGFLGFIALVIAMLSGQGGSLWNMISGAASSAKDAVVSGADKVASVGRSVSNTVSEGWRSLKSKFVSDMPQNETYVRAEKQGRDMVYHTADGDKVVKVRSGGAGGSLSWMNNNPGNMEFGNFARSQGAIGTDGRFAVFPTVEAGFAAQIALLNKNYSNLTLRQAIHKWCPWGDGDNNPELYTSRVSQQTGLDQNKRICDMSPEELKNMAQAMANQEGWIKGKVAVVSKAPEAEQPPVKTSAVDPRTTQTGPVGTTQKTEILAASAFPSEQRTANGGTELAFGFTASNNATFDPKRPFVMPSVG